MASLPGPISQQPSPAVVNGIVRNWSIPACSLSANDLRRLFELLNAKATEAANEQVAHQQQTSNLHVAAEIAAAREVMALFVNIQSASGEWRFGSSIAAVSDDSLPAVLTNITYQCGAMYRSRFNLFPQNQFSVSIDLTRTPLGDLSNLALGSGLGPGVVSISGVNSTWVNAVDHELHAFFADRANRRTWLHSKFAYDVAVAFIGIPLCLDGIYRLDQRLAPLVKLSPAVFVGLYVYLGLIGLLGFRIFFNYVKWVFPKIEGPSSRIGGAGLHKTVLVAVGLSLLVRAVTTILWFMGLQLH